MIDIEGIRRDIQAKGYAWEAEENYLTLMADADQRVRLGVNPPDGAPTIDDALRMQSEAGTSAPDAPARFDLRNVDGKNYDTAVKDQGGCGSCVAFGLAAAIEVSVKYAGKKPDLAVDLSEAHLFFCYAKKEGFGCNTGWWPANALAHATATGVVDEACFRYSDHDQNCTLCGDWNARLTRPASSTKLTDRAAMKEWVATRGALSACFVVYQDFIAYRTGVYRHASGGQLGGHCVAIVGYDDKESCWICRNSWDDRWGDDGYFRIAYGECGIDSWDVRGVTA